MITTPARRSTELTEIGSALRQTSEQSYDRAWTMPGAFYRSPEFLALECERLFMREWICIGRVEEVERPGDYLAVEILQEPVVVMHGIDGRIRAFSNVCRHRGMTIARNQGNAKGLVCPYHHWSYDSTGRLIGTPRMPAREDFEPGQCRLPQFALEEWQGFLFVCLAPEPAPLRSRLAPLEEMIRPYHLEKTTLRYVAEESWQTNWKNLLENFMEGYHLSALHHETLHNVNPTRLCRHFPPGEAYFGYYAGFTPNLPRSHEVHPDLSEAQRDDCVMFAVPPGFAVGCASDYSSFMCIQPEAIDRVRVKLGLIFFGDDWEHTTVETAVELFQRTMTEDKLVLAGLTRGLRSRYYHRGPLAPAAFEGPIWDFYRYMSRMLAPACAADP
jgi:phenylpropionate dioxygenase-like ring-hydroxylating dioxygenase large terminal subunit